MRLEEIRDALECARTTTDIKSWHDAQLEALSEKLTDAIAERALPVTREMKEALGAKMNGGNAFWYWLGDYAIDQELRVGVCGDAYLHGQFIRNVENVGQLLDLLSGLGVRK